MLTVTVGASVAPVGAPVDDACGAAVVVVEAAAVLTEAVGACDVAVAGIATVGAIPPRGSCPQIWENVMSCGAGALFAAPLPHFHP